MQSFTVKKSVLNKELTIPSSKSQTHRAILFASLAKGLSTIRNYLKSSDSETMIAACRNLGACIDVHDEYLEIEGVGGKVIQAEDVVYTDNSGIVLRFVSGIASLCSKPIVITGDHSIRHQRSMQSLTSSLIELGASIISTRDEGFAPLIIQGPIKAGKCVVTNGADSQNVSPLLIAALFLQGTTEIEVHHPGEKPWVDITLDWLRRLGVPYQNEDYKKYRVTGIGSYAGFDYTVPGDWSSAAFPMAAALITGSEMTLHNLDMLDLQGDKKIVDILMKMGAKLTIDMPARMIRVCKGTSLKGVTVDVNDCIDAITIVAVLGCYAEGETRITNAAVARQKECDRLACITNELGKMGATIQETEDGLIIQGSSLKGAEVLSYQDHRMAMSLAVAGLGAIGDTKIQDVLCINKTYPTFVKDLKNCGAEIL